jgi:hypothetical protein
VREQLSAAERVGMTSIILEPLLEVEAGALNASQCVELASVYSRWAHQLQMKAKILRKNRCRRKPAPRIRSLPLWMLARN